MDEALRDTVNCRSAKAGMVLLVVEFVVGEDVVTVEVLIDVLVLVVVLVTVLSPGS